ncbi:DUF1236 domain-containing protein [Roseivivax sp. GX 12232]|uniref:DUF1236 domain-containing protein n=1 Tax=Roseivivax sp. GX 12232 TaxID=2900547 RepID=UPI001E619DB5|nr:DUF1236 domain-containing protein [Roseivivax sp. GX 12232]MCE0504640.1 DUF1236 domain-containing protein [Roseivivax sp. GX 12232]
MLTNAKFLIAGTALSAAIAAPIAAQAVTTSEDYALEIQVTPESGAAVAATIPAEAEFTVETCLEAVDWCRVSYNGAQGWVQKATLDVNFDRVSVTRYDWSNARVIAVIKADEEADVVVDPAYTPVLAYARANPVSPVERELVIESGAVIPQDVLLYEVPESAYRYVPVNDQLVVVEPATRQVVYVEAY